MSGPGIGERQNLERALAKSPVVKAALEHQRLEDLERRRLAIARRKTAEARFAGAEASREERLARLEAEFRPIDAKYQAAKQKLETGKQLLEQEVGIARGELYAADQAMRELPQLEKFEAWRERTSRAMQLASPRGDPRPKREGFRSDAHFEEALERWNVKAAALGEQIHETARAVRSVMNQAPFICESDDVAIGLCERALEPLKQLVNFPTASAGAA